LKAFAIGTKNTTSLATENAFCKNTS